MVAGTPSDPGMATAVAYVPDLMDRSRLEIACRTAGRSLDFVRDLDELVSAVEGGAMFVIVDLAQPGVLDVLPRLGRAHTVGFGSHVDRTLLDAAHQAGCDEVLARSALYRRLARSDH
jgi:hypothetical protein